MAAPSGMSDAWSWRWACSVPRLRSRRNCVRAARHCVGSGAPDDAVVQWRDNGCCPCVCAGHRRAGREGTGGGLESRNGLSRLRVGMHAYWSRSRALTRRARTQVRHCTAGAQRASAARIARACARLRVLLPSRFRVAFRLCTGITRASAGVASFIRAVPRSPPTGGASCARSDAARVRRASELAERRGRQAIARTQRPHAPSPRIEPMEAVRAPPYCRV